MISKAGSFLCAVVFTATPMLASACGTAQMDFVQVSVGTLDGGERTFDSYRLMEDGTLYRAVWSNYGVLIGMAEGAAPDQASFKSAERAVRGARSGFSGFGGASGRPGQILDAVVYKNGKSGRQVERTSVPARITALIGYWQDAAPLTQADAGTYVWTNPSRPDGTNRDIDLSQDCESPVAGAIDAAMRTGQIAVKIRNGTGTFTSGANAIRSQFGAYTADDMIRFGVVKTR